MAINAYSGPATLVTDDGAERDATVDLFVEQEGGLKRWFGTARLDDVPPLEELRLRTPDGREGKAIITRVEYGSDEVELQGSGPPPFDFA
ncbi:hypothetical protein E1264_11690 [Actinomadura sp. KC216]|uniref:hypothetical protein n=1 Tax=Actinomadura sp. KC216 TaxID=2530370 RepID=UPI0010513496|nr:hypothetical protein [Actinomadura sp. KC216]TDB88338.1 hypothetical protein E1264_11690 [Actinomadura sp. KC216]